MAEASLQPPAQNPPHKAPRKYVFVVTYGRSGSTLLQALLNTLDGACIRGENYNLLMPLYQSVKQARRARQEYGKSPQPPDHPWYGAHLVDPAKFARGLANVFVERVICPPPGTRILGFKEIRYAPLDRAYLNEFLEFVLSAFENSFILFNQREPEAVAQSSWWADKPADEVVKMIESANESFATFAARRPKRTRLVRYEQVVADSEYIREVFQFLGEKMNDEKVAQVLGTKLEH